MTPLDVLAQDLFAVCVVPLSWLVLGEWDRWRYWHDRARDQRSEYRINTRGKHV